MARPRKGAEARTEVLSVRVPLHLRQRIDDYAIRFGITDYTIVDKVITTINFYTTGEIVADYRK